MTEQQPAPERIWIDAAPNLITGSMRFIYDTPPDPDLPIRSVEYVRSDLLQRVPDEKRLAEIRRIVCEVIHQHVPMTAQLPHGINGLESALVEALSLLHQSPTDSKG
jgi:hypothetical protein